MASPRSKSNLKAAGLNQSRLPVRASTTFSKADRNRSALPPVSRGAADTVARGTKVNPLIDPPMRSSRLVPQDLFSWNARNGRPEMLKDRKRLKIPIQVFGPSFKYGRLTNARVRLRFKEFFVFMDGPRREHREDTDDVTRFRTRFLVGVSAVVLYSLFQIFGS